jgi:hypothetical protein
MAGNRLPVNRVYKTKRCSFEAPSGAGELTIRHQNEHPTPADRRGRVLFYWGCLRYHRNSLNQIPQGNQEHVDRNAARSKNNS